MLSGCFGINTLLIMTVSFSIHAFNQSTIIYHLPPLKQFIKDIPCIPNHNLWLKTPTTPSPISPRSLLFSSTLPCDRQDCQLEDEQGSRLASTPSWDVIYSQTHLNDNTTRVFPTEGNSPKAAEEKIGRDGMTEQERWKEEERWGERERGGGKREWGSEWVKR